MIKQCIFRLADLTPIQDVVATLYYVHGVNEIFLPEYFKSYFESQNIDPKKHLKFLKFISNDLIKKCEIKATNALKSINITESICSRYPDKYYQRLVIFFQHWYVANSLNSQIAMLCQDELFDAINVLAYEYAGILPIEASKEIVAWIYANTPSKRSEVKFFEIKYRNINFNELIRKIHKEKMISLRTELLRTKSENSVFTIVEKIKRLSKTTYETIKEDWPDAITMATNALIATFINPMSWFSTSFGGIKFAKKIVNDTATSKIPIFSFEKVYYVDNLIPSADLINEDFDRFWYEARSGRLLSSPDFF